MTRWFNKTQNVTRYVNKTRWFNKTRNVTRYVNKTRWFNITRNVTRYVNKTIWIDKVMWINKTRNVTRYVNKTMWINKTRWVNKTANQTHAYVPTIIPKKLENVSTNTTTPARPTTVQDFVIWGSCLVIGFIGGCLFCYAVYKFKSFIDEWFGCCDIGEILENTTPPPSPKNKAKPNDIEIVTHPRVNTLRKRSMSNSPKNIKKIEI